MKATRATSSLFLAAVVVLVSLFLLLGNVTLAGAGSMYYYSLLANTMVPSDSTIQFDNFSTAFLTTSGNSTIPGNQTGYNGQVNLPDGATITGMGCEGRDTDPSNAFQVYMSRFSIDNSPIAIDIISMGNSSGEAYAGGNIKISGEILSDHGQQIVNNAVWAYNVFVVLPKASEGKELGVLRCWVSTAYSVKLPLVHR